MSTQALSVRDQLELLNELLTDLGMESKLSSLLLAEGLERGEVEVLRKRLFDYIELLSSGLCEFFSQVLKQRSAEIMVRRYGVDRRAPETLATLGERFEVSRERVRQIQRQSLRRLKWSKYRTQIRVLILEAARTVLGNLREEAIQAPGTGDQTRDGQLPEDPTEEAIGEVAFDSRSHVNCSQPARKPLPSYILDQRRDFPRAYERWTAAEEEHLRQLFLAGQDVEAIAGNLDRKPSAVRGRMVQLGLVAEDWPLS